jgi:hypothetical protein
MAGRLHQRAMVVSALLKSPLVSIDLADQVDTDSRRFNIDEARCDCCGISIRYPGVSFDEWQVCSHCRRYQQDRERSEAWFSEAAYLVRLLTQLPRDERAQFDCMLLYSGGKDSTYALYKLVEMGLSVTTFTLDNGFISARALDNIDRVTKKLGVTHLTLKPAGVGETIRNSLSRFSTPCMGCFRSLLDHALTRADKLGVRFIVTGLSRGQIMQERLEWFHMRNIYDPVEIEAWLEDGRRVYHQSPGFSGLNQWNVKHDEVLDRIKVVDFYRYTPVRRQEILAFLMEKDDVWRKPDECGFCSTNCLINDPGIALHKHQKGWHSYEGSNAWEVRLGHNPREDAVLELASVDPEVANATLSDLGLPTLPTEPDLRKSVVCRIAPRVTDAAVRSYLDAVVPDWDTAVRLIYRDKVAAPQHSSTYTPVRKPALEDNPRWLALAAQPRAWKVREHVLLALPLGLSIESANRVVLAGLARHRVVSLGLDYVPGGVTVRAYASGATGALRQVSLSEADSHRHRDIVQRLIQADEAAAKLQTNGPAMRAVLLDRGADNPWLLLSGSALLTRWSDWRQLVGDIGDAAAAAAGLASLSTPHRRPPTTFSNVPMVASRVDDTSQLYMPVESLDPRLITLDGAAGSAPFVVEWLDCDDQALHYVASDTTLDRLPCIGLRKVGVSEGCLPTSNGLTILIDPCGRWLSDRSELQLIVEPVAGGWLVQAHHTASSASANALLVDSGLISLLTNERSSTGIK